MSAAKTKDVSDRSNCGYADNYAYIIYARGNLQFLLVEFVENN
jgi:hypothetical protein